MMLFLSSSAAGQANPIPGTAFGAPYNQLFYDGVTLDSWQYVDATGRGATATAEMDGILAGGASWSVDSQTGPGAYDMSSFPQYNPAATPATMAYPPGGKGYTSAPAIYITDITGRGANAAAGVFGGSVTKVTMISGGSGYSQNPVVTFLGGGAAMQAVGSATVVRGVITEIKLLGCDYYEIEVGGYSERLIYPTMPDYGRDYVYYCHLFSNEELERMRAVSYAAPPRAPSNLMARVGPYVILSWTDNSVGETGFFLQRATNPGFTAGLVNIAVGPNVVSYIDTSVAPGRTYYYRVQAFIKVGDRAYQAPGVGYPGEYANSAFSNTVTATTAITAIPRTRADGIGVFRPSNQMFYLDYNMDGFADWSFAYGLAGDKPFSGDWNADGRDGVGQFRDATGTFHLDNNLDGVADKIIAFGTAGDKPISGDWDGDGLDGVGVFRNSEGKFYLDNNLDGIADKIFAFGNPNDEPISGDWDGDGLDGVGVYRVSTRIFYLDNNLDGILDMSFYYGSAGDKSLSGDWDGDGRYGVGIFRDSTQMFHLDNNLDGLADKIVTFGSSGDKPIAGRWG